MKLFLKEQINTKESKNFDIQYLSIISDLDRQLSEKYKSVMKIDYELSRQIVSFQANKNKPFYRWYKYKEGFSEDLVIYYINKRGLSKTKKILDPFVGSGTTLFASSKLEIDSVGIELLPIGIQLINSRNIIKSFNDNDFKMLEKWIIEKPWINYNQYKDFQVLRITKGAYSKENEILIKKYLSCIESENYKVRNILLLVLMCILENISFTRKDGQFLRWDFRSGRRIGAIPFDKGEVKEFNTEILKKIKEIINDAKGENLETLFDNIDEENKLTGNINLISGSCLNELSKLNDNDYDLVITSPPYCNRYDYTRTYALELALLGINEEDLIKLRQTMLSCTVENKEKDLLKINSNWRQAIDIANNQELLQEIIKYLELLKINNTINNKGLPKMVKGYFYEMACVIYELHRVLKKNGQVIMVNDNVKYAGANISVDLILSDIAKKIGFDIEEISILSVNKGNSSQQMSVHGREPLRKCVYIWKKK